MEHIFLYDVITKGFFSETKTQLQHSAVVLLHLIGGIHLCVMRCVAKIILFVETIRNGDGIFDIYEYNPTFCTCKCQP